MAIKQKLRSLEMFTGAGGLALATHDAGFEHEALVEWNSDACETLRSNSRQSSSHAIRLWNIIQGDVRDVDFRQFEGLDLLAGGPPCQPFSIGGKHHGKKDRRDMIPEFIRAVRQIRPRAFIMENVKGLTRQSFRNYFSYATLQLTYPDVNLKAGEDWTSHLSRLERIHTQGHFKDLHYNVVYRVLNSADFGVPQTRERVFIVGFRSDLGASWHFPKATHSREVLLTEQLLTGDYWEQRNLKPPRPATRLAAQKEWLKVQTKRKGLPWKTVRDAIAGLPEPKLVENSGFKNHRLQLGARSYAGHTGSLIDWPSKTLKAGDHGVPGGENMILYPNGEVRYFSVREAARVQTFPDSWSFEGAWSEAMRQLGNAVPVKLAQVVASSVAAELNKHADE
jgi:DNA (cytosine-5)-methyltransferase 1